MLIAVTLTIGSLSLAETNSPSTKAHIIFLRGPSEVTGNDNFSEFRKTRLGHAQDLLSGFDVYAVRQCHDRYHPTGHFGCLLIADGEIPIHFANMGDAATFLSTRMNRVDNDERAESILSLLPSMFGYKIVTVQPRTSNSSKPDGPKDTGTKDWTREFTKTETGWQLTCTLLFDPVIAYYNRVTITLDKSGKIGVSPLREVSSGPHYM